MNHPKTKGIVTFYSQDNITKSGTGRFRQNIKRRRRGSKIITGYFDLLLREKEAVTR